MADSVESDSEHPSRSVVEAAGDAAERAVFERIDSDDVADLDVRIRLDAGDLDVDVSVTAVEGAGYSESAMQAIADAAVTAATDAVDDRLT